MLKHIVTLRRIVATTLAAVLVASCGVKGPLVPAPKSPATPASPSATPPATTPVAPDATSAPPADPTDVPRKQ